MAEQLYEDLKREYDQTLDRRKTLTGLASNLISFAGIIQTVLVALILALATNKDARGLLVTSSYFPVLEVLAGFGFLMYILTAITSLMATREVKWMRIPQMPDKNPLDSIQDFYAHPDHYKPVMFAMQLSYATSINQETNTKKYQYLRIAYAFLLLGIIATGAAGIILLAIVQ